MKKLMTALAACVFAGAVFAQVESLNIVGYTTTGLAGGTFNQYPVQFGTVGGGGFNLNGGALQGDLFAAEGSGDADQILIWEPATSSYGVYYLYSDGLWYNFLTDVLFEVDYPAGLPAGTAFWYVSQAAGGQAVFSGEVPLTATLTKSVTGGTFNMLCQPYPVAAKLNDSTQCDWVACGAFAAEGSGNADQILIWEPATSSYGVYYLYSDGLWYNFVTDAAFEVDYPDGLPVGTAFWYSSKGASFTATFNKTF